MKVAMLQMSRRTSRELSLLGIVLALIVGWTAPAAAQFPPESLTNVQALPEDADVDAVVRTMAGFTRALGVRCGFCHMGEGPDLDAYDFAADDKLMKRKARDMIRMVGAINQEHLTGLEERASPAGRVVCTTCHSGVRVPRSIVDEVRIAMDTADVGGAVEHYRALRERFYGRATYDFGDGPLTELASDLGAEDRTQDAIRFLELNVELLPDSYFAHWQLSEALHTAGRTEEAIDHLERAVELNPRRQDLAERLEGWRGG